MKHIVIFEVDYTEKETYPESLITIEKVRKITCSRGINRKIELNGDEIDSELSNKLIKEILGE